ncbi:hypothetical protein [Thermococcus sp.]
MKVSKPLGELRPGVRGSPHSVKALRTPDVTEEFVRDAKVLRLI